MTPIDLPSLIAVPATQQRLRPRDDVGEIGWKFWELRNLNRHRVVGFVHEHWPFADVHDLEAEPGPSWRGISSVPGGAAWASES